MQYSDWEPLTNSEIFLKICFTAVPQSLFVMREEVAELVKSFEQVNEILDGFRYLNSAASTKALTDSATRIPRLQSLCRQFRWVGIFRQAFDNIPFDAKTT